MTHQPEVVRSRKVDFEAALNRGAGSRLTMNLVYYFDHGELAPDPLRVGQSENMRFTRAKYEHYDDEMVKIAFFRNPLLRFTRFYFEKIYNTGPMNWKSWRAGLDRMGFEGEAGDDLKAHQKNANLLLNLIESKAKRHGLFELPEYAAPQVKTMLPLQDYSFHAIQYSQALPSLSRLMPEWSDQLGAILAQIEEALAAPAPVNRFEMMHGDLAKRLQAIYAIDFDFFEAMRYGTT